MKYLIYLTAIVVLLGINIGLFNNLQIRGQIPNLLFLMSLFFVLGKNDFDFFFVSLAAGLFLDFLSAGFFGIYTLTFLLLSLGIYFFVNNLVVVELNWKSLSLALVFCLLVFNILVWFFGLASFKFGWAGNYTNLKVYMDSFPASLFYNWLLLYPMYLASNSLKILVENLTMRRRGIIR
jgi:cell shape-determining protein MreD